MTIEGLSHGYSSIDKTIAKLMPYSETDSVHVEISGEYVSSTGLSLILV